jgi:O-antigen ligase
MPRRRDAVRRPRRALVATLLLVLVSVGWRRGTYFSGSLDPVVLAKGLLGLVALGLALAVAAEARRQERRRRLGSGSLWALAVFLGISVLGALTDATLLASAVVAFRVAVLALAVVALLRAAPVEAFLTDLARCCGGVAAVATVTGLPHPDAGRLAGGIPQLSPNELALLAGVVVLHAVWRCLLDRPRWASALGGSAALVVMWATGSRTAVLVLLAAVVLVALHVRRPRVGLVVGGLVAAAAVAVAVVTTGAVGAFLARGDTGAGTLQSRFTAWRAALGWAPTLWQSVFGGGLSVKIIPVQTQFRDTQPLDSSWVSALVQAGVLGLLVCVGWALWVLHGTLRTPRTTRALLFPLVLFLVCRGVLESGLFDATPAFLAFVAVSVAVERGSRAAPDAVRSPGDTAVRRPAAVAVPV